jgi:hypothetical protein
MIPYDKAAKTFRCRVVRRRPEDEVWSGCIAESEQRLGCHRGELLGADTEELFATTGEFLPVVGKVEAKLARIEGETSLRAGVLTQSRK